MSSKVSKKKYLFTFIFLGFLDITCSYSRDKLFRNPQVSETNLRNPISTYSASDFYSMSFERATEVTYPKITPPNSVNSWCFSKNISTRKHPHKYCRDSYHPSRYHSQFHWPLSYYLWYGRCIWWWNEVRFPDHTLAESWSKKKMSSWPTVSFSSGNL